MKYSNSNKPLECMMTQSTCYKGTTKMAVKGVLWHSTGANNSTLKRYVQPDDNASNRAELMAMLGTNSYKNDWNHISLQAGVNAFIGKLADGTVTTVQVMPWDYKPWGCGSGSRGSCNNGWIQFEICEDGLSDKTYFEKIYNEACELTAYLCKMYNLDPMGYDSINGYEIPVILCHADANSLKVGSAHGDVLHWFPKHGKTMDDVRRDVAKLMGMSVSTITPAPDNSKPATSTSTSTSSTPSLRKGATGEAVKELQTSLNKLGYSCGAVDGSFGDMTLAAVLAFQKKYGLVQDGYVGPATWEAIELALKNLETPKEDTTPETVTKPSTSSLKDGDVITLVDNATYVDGKEVPAWVKNSTVYYRGVRPNGDVVISVLKTGAVTGVVPAKMIVEASSTTIVAPKEEVVEFKPYVARVTANLLNYRSGPGSNYSVKGQIKKGEAYTIVEEKDGWGKLKSGNNWVSLEYMQKVEILTF